MKYLLRVYFFTMFALWVSDQILPTMTIGGGWQTVAIAGLFLSLLNLIVAPLLKILFIPINILTFGLLSWLINVVVVYLMTLFVTQVQIQPFPFTGATLGGFVIPAMYINYPVALVVSSITITIVVKLLQSVSES